MGRRGADVIRFSCPHCGREYALVEDLHALVKDALRHRLVLSYQALAEEVSPDAILDQVLAAVPVPHLDLARVSAA